MSDNGFDAVKTAVIANKVDGIVREMTNTLLRTARSAVINAAAALDADRVTRERALSAAKMSIGRIGALVAEECIQLHGGIGMTDEHDIGLYLKRIRVAQEMFGDTAYHADRFAKMRGY